MPRTDGDLEQTIRDAAATPASASGDGLSTTERPLEQLIAADKHLSAKQAMQAPGLGIRMLRVENGGA